MGLRIAIMVVAVLLLGTAGAYAADLEGKTIPFLTPPPIETVPASVEAIGTPAPPMLPDTDYATWFAAAAAPAAGAAPTDPYSVVKWRAVADFAVEAGTEAGWTEACKAAGTAAGADRTKEPLLGALGCSDDPSVTLIQQFALRILAAQARLALWIRGVPGNNDATVLALQGEIRLMCANDVIAREGGAGSAYSQACALSLDAAYRSGDGPTTFTALAGAYKLVADEIAVRDPSIDPEPGFYTGDPAASPTP